MLVANAPRVLPWIKPADSALLQEKGRLLLQQSKGNIFTRNLKRAGSVIKRRIARSKRKAMFADEIGNGVSKAKAKFSDAGDQAALDAYQQYLQSK